MCRRKDYEVIGYQLSVIGYQLFVAISKISSDNYQVNLQTSKSLKLFKCIYYTLILLITDHRLLQHPGTPLMNTGELLRDEYMQSDA